MNQTLENRMLMLIAQAHAVSYEEVREMYTTLMSIDKIISIVDISNRSGLSLAKARDIFESNK